MCAREKQEAGQGTRGCLWKREPGGLCGIEGCARS